MNHNKWAFPGEIVYMCEACKKSKTMHGTYVHFRFFSSSKRRVRSSKSISSSMLPLAPPGPARLSSGTEGRSGKSKSGGGLFNLVLGLGFGCWFKFACCRKDRARHKFYETKLSSMDSYLQVVHVGWLVSSGWGRFGR